MPDFRDQAPEPEMEAALAVIDATLAGEPVAPEDAELAELSLILVGERPQVRPEFARQLDDRFRHPPERLRRRWRLPLWMPASVATVAAVVVAVVLVLPGLHGSPGSSVSSSSAAASSAGSAKNAAGASQAGRPLSQDSGSVHRAPSSASSASSSAPSLNPAPASPSGTGRQVVRGASIALQTSDGAVDTVAQHVFDIAARENGVVENSSVSTGTSAGYAQIQLSVPSSNLEATMTALSNITGAQVTSRTDNTQDITGQVGGFGRRLYDAKQLRTSLLKQLAAATTTTEIDSLKQQLSDVEAQINGYQQKLNGLHSQVANSQVQVQINAGLAAGGSSGGGFTLHRALHDAGRVLVVAAGVGLIAAAVLVPLGLAVGIATALVGMLRRRRREQALDLI